MSSHRPRKRFGQNFLHDPAVIRSIIDAIDPRPGDTLVEIGPGLGALTGPLLERLPHIHVVEIDRDIVAKLREDYPPERVTIHEGDVLEFDFRALPAPLRIVGNLPYNISTPLLFHVARFADRVRDLHVMLQKEVVDRMLADPGSSVYGRLSVMLQYRFDMHRVRNVGPGAFRPAPKVDSAVVCMIPRPRAQLVATDEARLARVVTAAFTMRRKTLRNALAAVVEPGLLDRLGIDSGMRPETLSVGDFVRIANGCTP